MRENLSFEDKKTWVKGLVIHCPMGDSVKDCPANEIRLHPIRKRLRIVDEMSESDIEQIIDYHLKCLAEREGFRVN